MEIIRLASGYSQTTGYKKSMWALVISVFAVLVVSADDETGMTNQEYYANFMPRRRPATAHIIMIAGSIKPEAFSAMEEIAVSAVIVEPQSTAVLYPYRYKNRFDNFKRMF